MARKVSKRSKKRLIIFGTLSVVMIFYAIYSAFYYAIDIYTLSSKKEELTSTLDNLKSNEQSLGIEIEKLNDPDYLARYARENYLYSKNGEYIIKIESSDEELTTITSGNDYQTIIVMGVAFLITVFIFKKKNQKQG
ncbi:MAG: septum formation initiator family protein [Bacilli bacterium]|nr:septum formation initiator family protein [Bacilli bacterium]